MNTSIRRYDTLIPGRAEESNKTAASWVKKNLAGVKLSPHQITAGKVRIYKATYIEYGRDEAVFMVLTGQH